MTQDQQRSRWRKWLSPKQNLHGRFGNSGRGDAELADISTALMTAMDTAEPRFLEMGEALQTLEQDARRLNRLTRNSARAARGMDEGETEAVQLDTMVENALDRLKKAHDSISESLSVIGNSLERLNRLCAICPVIEKAGMFLNVVGFNISVESSRSDDARQMFEIFSEEIRGLSRKISTSSRHILTDSLATRNRQKAAQADIIRRTEEFEGLYKEAENVVRQAAGEIRTLMDISAKTLDETYSRSRAIEREIGEVVVGLQFHDIARQKIEHITAALRDVHSSGDGTPGGHGGVIRLQTEQLKQVVEDLQQAYNGSRNAFRMLRDHVADLTGETDDSDSRNDRVQHRIGILKEGLAQLSRLLTQGRAMEESVKRNAARIADMAVQLSHHVDQVRGISRDLHLNALNAIVKSTRLHSEGRALEILAQEVSRLSVETSGFVDDVVAEINALISLAETMDADSLGTEDRETRLIETGINEMAENYEQSIADAAEARREAKTLRDRIGDVQQQLPFMEAVVGELTKHWRRLSRLSPDDHQLSIGETKAGEDSLHKLAERYTMASEREVHYRHAGGGERSEKGSVPRLPDDAGAEPSEKSKEKEKAEEDFGDNVELF